MITAYDKRQLRKARLLLQEAAKYVDWALQDRGDAALRCFVASGNAAVAQELLDQADRRITERQS